MSIAPFISYEYDITNFKINEEIGSGGNGTIYEISDIKTGKKFALKTITYSNDEDEEVKKIRNREAEIQTQIYHPAINKALGYCKKDFKGNDGISIIMELKANSLDKILEKIRLGHCPQNYDNNARQQIMYGVAQALKFLHDHFIVHRDLKPANVLLDENNRPYLSDFGSSKKINNINEMINSGYGVGTLPYLAPEILTNDDDDYDPFKADIYAFGIMLFEITTNQVPYKEFPNKIIKKKIKEDYRPTFPINVKESIQNLIKSCFAKNPYDRPSINEIVIKLATFDKKDYILDDVDIDKYKAYCESIANYEFKQFGKILKENEQLKDDINIKNSTIKNLLKENEILKNTVRKNESDINKTSSQIEEIKMMNRKLTDQNNKYQIEKEQNSTAINKMKSQIEETNLMNKKLTDQNNKYQIEKKQNETVINKMKSQIEEINLMNKKLTDRNNKYQIENEQNSTAINKMKSEVSKLISTNNSLNDHIKKLNLLKDEFNSKNKLLISQNEDLIKQNSAYEESKNQNESEMNNLKQLIDELTLKNKLLIDKNKILSNKKTSNIKPKNSNTNKSPNSKIIHQINNRNKETKIKRAPASYIEIIHQQTIEGESRDFESLCEEFNIDNPPKFPEPKMTDPPESLRRQIREQLKWNYYITNVLEQLKIALIRAELVTGTFVDVTNWDAIKRFSSLQIRFQAFIEAALENYKKIHKYGGWEAMEPILSNINLDTYSRSKESDNALAEFFGDNYKPEDLKELLAKSKKDAQLLKDFHERFGENIKAQDLGLALTEGQVNDIEFAKAVRNALGNKSDPEILRILQSGLSTEQLQDVIGVAQKLEEQFPNVKISDVPTLLHGLKEKIKSLTEENQNLKVYQDRFNQIKAYINHDKDESEIVDKLKKAK